MTILIAAIALATAPATTAAQPVPAMPAMHAQHSQNAQQAQPGATPKAEGCCCKKMGEGGKMAGCAEHGEGQGGAHAEHAASR